MKAVVISVKTAVGQNAAKMHICILLQTAEFFKYLMEENIL